MKNNLTAISNPVYPSGYNGPGFVEELVNGFIGALTIIGGIIFVIMVFSGAVEIISAGADKVAYENAKKKIATGVIGLVVLIGAIFLINIVATFLGASDLFDITGSINKIKL